MSKNLKYRLGAVAIKYNVGGDTLVSLLKEKGFSDVESNLSYVLSDEQYAFIDNLFNESLLLKQQVVELRNVEMTDRIIDLLPSLVDLLIVNEKLKNLSYYKFPWKESEVQGLVKNYLDFLPKDIIDNIKAHNLIKRELFDEIESFFNKKVDVKKIKRLEPIEDIDNDNRDSFDDGPYCSACQQAPCMCSDPEQSSMTFWS